ncbi:MAG TPA: alpha/beta hydrolase [Gemmataceae bacterium]|jgi:pimeloyl-ACP methyl ester carboxylesterase|nr:alpha/beta hydrolase [Gemmataceae bacterium]
MSTINHRQVQTNGIRMHIAEQGTGPLVVLLHGFPESWYSWRHQIAAISAAGFHVVAPDQRGYGRTDCPEPIAAYDILQLTGDVVGLVHALGEKEAVVIGHDWGAPVAWYSALLRPDIFRGLGLLSVPYLQRQWTDPRPTDAMNFVASEGEFYQRYFQKPGRAEADLEADVRKGFRMFLYSASGDPPPDKRWRFVFGKNERFMDTGTVPERLPNWLAEDDIENFAKDFERTGFRGPLNWYRNLDRMWEQNGFLAGAPIRQPSVFVAGDVDAVIAMYRPAYDALEQTMPGLRKKALLPGAGHWIQQERPTEVNQLLVEFLKGLV